MWQFQQRPTTTILAQGLGNISVIRDLLLMLEIARLNTQSLNYKLIQCLKKFNFKLYPNFIQILQCVHLILDFIWLRNDAQYENIN